MAPSSTDSFDPNQYYRLTNLGLGGEFSLDVDNPQTTPPNGSTSLALSEQVSGQIWQILELNDTAEDFLISSAFLGAKLKLDALINSRGDYAPQLRNYTTEYNQTWKFVPHIESSTNRTTWSIIPDFLATSADGALALSVYNDSTRKPYLAPIIPDSQIGEEGQYQRWFISEEGVTIDDPTFSSTHLPALATEAPVSPAGEPTVTPTTTAVVTVIPTAASDDSSSDRLTGSLIAAAVVPSTVFFLAVAGLLLYFCMKRRKLRKMHENSPYSSSGGYSRGGGGGVGGVGPASTFVSEILETFHSDETGGKRTRVVELEMKAAAAGAVPSYLSVLSSNLSGSFRSLSRGGGHHQHYHPHPQDSTASGLASPLSAPPPVRVSRRSLRHLTISPAAGPDGAAAAAAVDQAQMQTLLPSPLVPPGSPGRWPKSPKSPKSPQFPGMAMISEEENASRGKGGQVRQRSSVDMQIYDCMELSETRIGQAI